MVSIITEQAFLQVDDERKNSVVMAFLERPATCDAPRLAISGRVDLAKLHFERRAEWGAAK